jgi:cyanophycinase
LLASGVVMHVLPENARFDLDGRVLLPFDVEVDPQEAAEMEEAGRDLRQMARDIAAGDASPSVLRRRLRRSRTRRMAARAVGLQNDGDTA